MAVVDSVVTVAPGGAGNASARDTRRALWNVYRRALRRYVPAAGEIVPRSIERTDDGWVVHEGCPLNTAEMLKAAFMMDARRLPHPFDAHALLDRMMSEHLASADYQVAALTLWAASVGDSRHADTLLKVLISTMPRDASQSMPLGWTLSALGAYAARARSRGEASASTQGELKQVARTVYERLAANQDARSGLFFASARREGWLRRRVANATLSSQTYPVLGLVSYAQTFGQDEALARAERCAARLCQLQGPNGQWWRRYDARRGSVLERYPVYSVNQDSAIPGALGQLQRALGDSRYDPAIARGLQWVSGENEASQSLIDERGGFVAQSLAASPQVTCSWEMYTYQPARFIYTVLAHPEWADEVTA